MVGTSPNLENAVNKSYSEFLQFLDELVTNKTPAEIVDVLNTKDANSAYITLVALNQIYNLDMFNQSWLSAFQHVYVGTDWEIVSDDVFGSTDPKNPNKNENIKDMIGGLMGVSQYAHYCRFISSLQMVDQYDNNITCRMPDIPISINVFIYYMPPNVEILKFGPIASLFLNQSAFEEIARDAPYVYSVSARNRNMLSGYPFGAGAYYGYLTELHEVGLQPMAADGSPIQYNFAGMFPPTLTYLELSTMGTFDYEALIYGGDDSGQYALVNLQTLIIGMNVQPEQAAVYEANIINLCNELGMSCEVKVYPAGNLGGDSGATVANPLAKRNALVKPDGTQTIKVGGKSYVIVPQ